ncbi:MAG: hypothetical protein Q6363_009075 [Candidatus Njordarchaeota archaeon]
MKKHLIVVAVVAVLFVSLVLLIIMLPRTHVVRVEISDPLDDGAVCILADYGPVAGYTNGGLSGALVGAAKGGEHDVLSRGLYRFYLKDWDNQNVVLHLYCTIKNGSPGSLEIYVINDFGKLPENQTGDPRDVSDVWNLSDSGHKIDTVTPEVGKWFEVEVSASIISDYISDEKYIAFMIILSNEESLEGYYGLSTYEYAETENIDPPYLTWEA